MARRAKLIDRLDPVDIVVICIVMVCFVMMTTGAIIDNAPVTQAAMHFLNTVVSAYCGAKLTKRNGRRPGE